MNSKLLIKKLWKLFPIKIAKKYNDFVGVMVPIINQDIKKISLCLDVDPNVIDISIKNNVDLIISHHPFFYGKKKDILKYDLLKNEMYKKLLNNKIGVYSFHTNFDEGHNGMNDALLNKLELENITPIKNLPMARKGVLKNEMEIKEFSKYVIEKLDLKYAQLINKGKNMIKTVGILGGSGAREYQYAFDDGCDIFLSGDTPYHIRREIIDKKYNYLHIDHEVEKIFCYQMFNILKRINSDLEVLIIDDVEQSELIIR